jgi:opacity protein-like surface antigen
MKYAIAILAVFAITLTAKAQTGLVVSAGSEAVAYDYAHTWSAGTHLTQDVDVIDWGAQKGNSFSAEVSEFLAPTPAINSYLVGGKFTPDLSGLLGKTNLGVTQFQMFVQGAGGETTLPGLTASTGMAGGGASWMATPNLTVNMADGYWLRFNGQNTFVITAGVRYLFNPQASQSMSMKRWMLRRASRR